MADLEAVLADVSYLMAMEKSKSCPAARASKKIVLPDPSVRWVMHKHLEKNSEATFDKIFHQTLGYLLFKEFCETVCDEPVPQLLLYEDIKLFEKLESDEERIDKAREIYDTHIMKDLLAQAHIYSNDAVEHVQDLLIQSKKTTRLAVDAFESCKREICESLSERIFDKFLESDKYTRYCQWKNFELNLLLTMNDFSVHRIIGRGGFGEVYGCRKVDTGKMYAMKCLDKKRIKLKCGESLAMNERNMLAAVSSGDGSPFIVCMTYAFQTSEKLCFVLDLMNGGDLHYHLSQHGVFSEQEARFYAAEVLLGLEHMHKRSIVYRDLKPANILLDENGHVKISDLGLACDFSKKKPHASVGTHGYMAPEVLAKGVAYDSAADWFSFGCMLYKILRGHSPFRPPKNNKDKFETDKPTLTMVIEMPDSFSPELRDLLEALMRRDPAERLGGSPRGADDVKEHNWFAGVDWQLASLQKYPPPIIPPRGEVNAADAFDIGNFDEEDTKGIKLTDTDQEYYRHFSLVVSNRWQQEMAETVFAVCNQEADKAEMKRRSKPKSDTENDDVPTDCIVEGEVLKLEGRFMNSWEKRHLRLYPNRIEFYQKRDGQVVKAKGVELVSMLDIKEIHQDFQKVGKNENCIVLLLKTDQKIVITSTDKILITQWKDELLKGFRLSTQILSTVTPKVCRVYGAGAETMPKEPLAASSSNGSPMSPSGHTPVAPVSVHAQSQLQPGVGARHSDSNDNLQKSRQSSVDKER